MKKITISKSKVVTSTLPEDLIKQIDEYSLIKGIQKNKIIEEALRSFFKSIERKEFRDSLKKYGRDPEIVEMAEWGMKDYAKQLEKYPYDRDDSY